jgi:glutathione S-transferase
MLDYKFYYWEVPFRGNFIQIFLEEVKAQYERHEATEIYPEKSLKIRHPGMAPPYLYDCKTKKYLAQMPAILLYLGGKYGYLPKRPETLALAFKTILDCNDVLLEITNCYGMEMWDKKNWKTFRSKRLAQWMTIFEKTGLEYGLKADHSGKTSKKPRPGLPGFVRESKPGPGSGLSLSGKGRNTEGLIAGGKLKTRYGR